MILIFGSTLTADLIINYNDLSVLTDDGCYIAGISVIIFKLYKFNSVHERIKLLVDEIHRPMDILSRSPDLEARKLIKRTAFLENSMDKFFIVLGCFLAAALTFFVPKQDGALPIRAVFPFDTAVAPMHELAFAVQAFSIFYGLLTIVFMDELIITLIMWINCQLVILRRNYETCGRNVDRSENEDKLLNYTFVMFDETDPSKLEGNFVDKFKYCIKQHQRLIIVVDHLNEIFSSSMLMQLFASFSMICLTGFQAVLGANEKEHIFKFILYLGAAFSQLLNWCWFGNELLHKSASLTYGQWSSGWENHINKSLKPLMIISLMRTQKILQLQAGNFYNMSLHTFTAVLKNSYSFFALLTKVTDN
ncbi:odorant receptor 13a-like isoform X2 [Cotesia glomerata]|nr:odorant receptor 13a-like isoform X2 [Cotesia glomerata]